MNYYSQSYGNVTYIRNDIEEANPLETSGNNIIILVAVRVEELNDN